MKESRPALVLRERVKMIEKQTGYKGLSLGDELRLPTASEFVRENLTLTYVIPMPYGTVDSQRFSIRLFCLESIVFWVAISKYTEGQNARSHVSDIC